MRLRDKEFREQQKQLEAGYQIALAQTKQAAAQLKEVQAELRRAENMSEQSLISDADLESVQTRAVRPCC